MTIDTSTLNDLLAQMPTDLRMEALARELLEENLWDISHLITTPEGTFKRAYSRDVLSLIEDWNSDSDSNQHPLKIRTTREGILDMIPLGVIYQPLPNVVERTTEVMAKEVEIHEEDVRKGRLFFSPFDIELGRQRIKLEQQEHQALTVPFTCYQDLFFELFWSGLDIEITNWQKELLLQLTMNAHQIAGDMENFGAFIQPLLGHSVRLQMPPEAFTKPEEMPTLGTLGNIRMGVDWIAAGRYNDWESLVIQIIVGPVPASDLIHYVHHGRMGKYYRLLAFLCDLLLPVEAAWELIVDPQDGFFTFNSQKDTGILGYTTILNS